MDTELDQLHEELSSDARTCRYPTAHLKLELLGDCLRRQFYRGRRFSEVAVHNDVIDVLSLPAVLRAFRKRAPAQAQHNSSLGGDALSDSDATDRLFFYEFARSRCEAYDDAYLHQRMHHGTRSPAPFSVNGPLRNLGEFAEAFDCPRGSDMRPHSFCTI
ncbi:neprilysin-3-like [Amblyomma americanum]